MDKLGLWRRLENMILIEREKMNELDKCKKIFKSNIFFVKNIMKFF